MALRSVKRLLKLLKDDEGQDLVEYTLLIAFICLASAVLISGSGATTTNKIWMDTNNYLSNAAIASS
jgi:Flp pilus assembly pilin Flp